jgi:hypothetical protein
MIAYNKTALASLALLKKARLWYTKKLLTAEQFATITTSYNHGFYLPAFFIRAGLFVFTAFIISSALGSYLILTSGFSNLDSSFFQIFNCLLFSVACTLALELVIKRKKTCHSGMDNSLLYAGLSFALSALYVVSGLIAYQANVPLLYALLALPLLGAALVRYNDGLVALLFGICNYALLFLLLLKLGPVSKLLMPFAFMLLSVGIYLKTRQYAKQARFMYWQSSNAILQSLSLLLFYLAGNYFIIRESSVHFFDLQLAPGENVPFALLFYLLTAVVPLLYIYFGLTRKDRRLLHIGLLILAASVLTFKYYFSLGHPEITLTIAGLLMILIAYFTIRYLKTPKHGICFEEDTDEHSIFRTNAEALIIAQSLTQQHPTESQPGTAFGGGKFGGGGAGNEF